MSTVVPLRRKPAYTPMNPPGQCMTPGHEDREARNYPGGWLCTGCIEASRRGHNNSDEKEARAS